MCSRPGMSYVVARHTYLTCHAHLGCRTDIIRPCILPWRYPNATLRWPNGSQRSRQSPSCLIMIHSFLCRSLSYTYFYCGRFLDCIRIRIIGFIVIKDCCTISERLLWCIINGKKAYLHNMNEHEDETNYAVLVLNDVRDERRTSTFIRISYFYTNKQTRKQEK